VKNKKFLERFSKLTKHQKLELIADCFDNSQEFYNELKGFDHQDIAKQKLFDEFSENTISNFYFPYGIAPNFLINGSLYHIPMVIEESSVVAAAANSAKFWYGKGGFHSEVISAKKIGQVHFIWEGDAEKLRNNFEELKTIFLEGTEYLTENMRKRGGGIQSIEFIDKTTDIENYYQIFATFDTVNSMGANFINSCLEEFAVILQRFLKHKDTFQGKEKECQVIMSILSNYTPECVVKSKVECNVSDLDELDKQFSGEEIAWRFEKAVSIAQVDVYRATTHNKGIFNGVDAVALATGNDFRAIEACGHTWASRNGKYAGLSSVSIQNGRFQLSLEIPMAVGTVGGLTTLHPMAQRSMELLGNPDAEELMRIIGAVGLANHFSAIRSLVTRGIQFGHMKIHLINILNSLNASDSEKIKARNHFSQNKVSYNSVVDFLNKLRT